MIGIKFNQFQQKDNYLSPQNEKTTVYADRPGVNYDHALTLLLYCPYLCYHSFVRKWVVFLSGSEPYQEEER
jgi:hypothetical protein